MCATTIACPVCGAGAEMRKGRTNDCASCSTPSAFAEFFASAQTYQSWTDEMRRYKGAFQAQKIQRLRESGKLIVGSECVAFHNVDEKRLVLFDQSGEATVKTDVKQYSVSNCHQVILKSNGTVDVKGDIEADHVRASDSTNIKMVVAAPRCTYLVNADGTVVVRGANEFREEVAKWNRIKAVACGKNHVVGLKEDGTVVQADNRSETQSIRRTDAWRNVTAIAAASNYTLALHANGTVSYAGPREDVAKEIAVWKDVVAIAADSQYAICLTGDGQVHLAGNCNAKLDGGRSQAREWKNVVCIDAGQSVIAGVTDNGELLIAGWCLHREDIVSGFKQYNPTGL